MNAGERASITDGWSRTASRQAAAGFLIAALAVALAAAVYLARPRRLELTGDEPHYLVMADALVRDRTLDLRNAYAREAASHRFHGGDLAPHVVIVNHRWAPYHGPALGLALAIPLLLGGTVGVKLAFCLFAGLLPLALHRFLSVPLSPASASWLTVGLVVCLPFCFGASQIYPDLVGGAIATGLAIWLIRSEAVRRNTAGWALFWLGAGLLPSLNVKYIATTAALAIWAIGTMAQVRKRSPAVAGWRALAPAALVLVGPLTLAAFQIWAVGTPFGPRPLREVASPFSRAAMMFLGLHFDQSQGMFVQHPLLLAGVAAWPVFAWRRPRLAVCWIVLYASLIVPNSMELARWGGGGPVGRFTWSAEWLWAIPLGFTLGDPGTRLERFIKPAVIASLAYQALLALRWAPNLQLLFPRLEEGLDARDSLFPMGLRPFLPSFYFWDFSSYWTYPPNLAAYAVFAGLIAIGLRSIARGDRRRRLAGN